MISYYVIINALDNQAKVKGSDIMKFTAEEFYRLRRILNLGDSVSVLGSNKLGEPVAVQGKIQKLSDGYISIDIPVKQIFKKESKSDANCSVVFHTDLPKQEEVLFFDESNYTVIQKEDFKELKDVNRLFVYAILDKTGKPVFENKDAKRLEDMTKLYGSITELQNKLEHTATVVDDPVTKALRTRIGKQTLIYLGEGVGTKRCVVNAVLGIDKNGDVLVEVQNGYREKTIPVKKDTMIFEETKTGINMIANNNPQNRKEKKMLKEIYDARLSEIEKASRVERFYPDKEAKRTYDELCAQHKKQYDELYRVQKKRAEEQTKSVTSGIASRLFRDSQKRVPEIPMAVKQDMLNKQKQEELKQQEAQKALRKSEEELANTKAFQPH